MSETISCTHCGNAFAKGDRFCPKCGTEAGLGPDTAGNLETRIASISPTVCLKCSAEMGRDDRFCPKCGHERPEEATVVSHVSLRNAQAAHLADATRGEFEIIQQLGLGAMGSVYLARDIALSRKVAIKVIASNLLQDESMVSRFRLEAQTVASLRHPNIVNVHAVRQADDLHYFVMDFIDGPPLRSLVKNHAPLEVPVVQALLYQVGTALDYAHHRGKGVIHRDIKPANIMVDREGNAFVTDFGISKIAESQTGLTQTGATIGTPEYMSPEQCRGEELTGASDQYAVGIMAYEMLTGQTPFSGSQYYIMVAHTSEDAAPIPSLRPDCPPHVADAVHRMLAKAPGDRWPDLESAVAAMGGKPLGRKDPVRRHITALAGSTQEVRALDTASPLSPVPGTPADAAVDTATSVTVLGMPTRVEEGDSFTLSADVRGTTQGSMPGATVAWASTDPAVAAVTEGQVRALKAGTAVISASVGGVTNSVSVHVAQAAPAAVIVDPHTVHVSSGERVSLSARVQDRHGNDIDRVIRWLTSDAGVASVTREGELVATGSGVATVTAESGGVTGTAEIVVQGTGARVPVGLRPPKRAAWRHPAALAVAIVLLGAGGVYGAMQAGLIGGGDAIGGEPASESEGTVAQVEIQVPGTLTVGDTVPLDFAALSESNAPVEGAEATWSAGDGSGLALTADGRLAALRAGSFELSAAVQGVVSTLTVQVDQAPAQAAANPEDGQARPSQPASQPASRPTEAAEDPPPRETTPTPAETRPQPFVPRPSSWDVRIPDRMQLGEAADVRLRVRDQRGSAMNGVANRLDLRSSDPSVVAVEGVGRLRAAGVGTAEITASLGQLTQAFRVSVPSPVAALEITTPPLELEVGEVGRVVAGPRGPAGGALAGVNVEITWTTSDPGVATVDADGTVRAVGPGSATLTASGSGFAAETSVRVSASGPARPSQAELRGLLATYLGYVNDENKTEVTNLHGAEGRDELSDLLDWMDNNNFRAELSDVRAADAPGGVAVLFNLAMQYRSGFGGNQTRNREFRAVLARSGARWILRSVVMLPD